MNMVVPKRRFDKHFKVGKPMTISADHFAAVKGTTIFQTRVAEPNERLLKSGEHQRKIGARITKGVWAGMPIYTLTLEERATCPRSCEHWLNCYGNHMHWPKRYRAGRDLENRLPIEVASLDCVFPRGFVVRLHILGDFYSVEYVQLWAELLKLYPKMHVFGYTARHPFEEIGLELQKIRDFFPDRWWVRWSNRDYITPLSTGKTGIVCPVQTGKTDCCGTCGLCWTAYKPIQFLLH